MMILLDFRSIIVLYIFEFTIKVNHFMGLHQKRIICGYIFLSLQQLPLYRKRTYDEDLM